MRDKILFQGAKPRKVLQILTVPIIDFCCKTLIILLDSFPVKPRRSIPCSRQVGIEPNAPTIMGKTQIYNLGIATACYELEGHIYSPFQRLS